MPGIFLLIFCLIHSLLRIVLYNLSDQAHHYFTFTLKLLPLGIKVGGIGQRLHDLVVCLYDFLPLPQNAVEGNEESGLYIRFGQMRRFTVLAPVLLVALPHQRPVRRI